MYLQYSTVLNQSIRLNNKDDQFNNINNRTIYFSICLSDLYLHCLHQTSSLLLSSIHQTMCPRGLCVYTCVCWGWKHTSISEGTCQSLLILPSSICHFLTHSWKRTTPLVDHDLQLQLSYTRGQQDPRSLHITGNRCCKEWLDDTRERCFFWAYTSNLSCVNFILQQTAILQHHCYITSDGRGVVRDFHSRLA